MQRVYMSVSSSLRTARGTKTWKLMSLRFRSMFHPSGQGEGLLADGKLVRLQMSSAAIRLRVLRARLPLYADKIATMEVRTAPNHLIIRSGHLKITLRLVSTMALSREGRCRKLSGQVRCSY